MARKLNKQKVLEQAAQLARRGQFGRALPLYQSLLKSLPGHPDISLHYAHALGLSGQRETAVEVHQNLLDVHAGAPELRVRMARDREEWKDFEGALACWSTLTGSPSRWKQEAEYHRVRLLERCNRMPEAREAWSRISDSREDVWGWYWLEGQLALREGDTDTAREAFRKGYDCAEGDFRVKCAGALARVADREGDYVGAMDWVKKLAELRDAEAVRFKNRHPLSATAIRLPDPGKSASMPEAGAASPLIFLTGFPRAGTTLMAHRLAQAYDLALSEEYPYLRHLVDQQALGSGKLPAPDKLVGSSKSAKDIAAYWEAQRQSVPKFSPGTGPLLDKNPSQAILVPWVLALLPQTRILWMERDPRDLWLSSVMLDAPVNPITCWWCNPVDFAAWLKYQNRLRDQLAAGLAPDQFMRISYEDLVGHPDETLNKVAQGFDLDATTDPSLTPLVTSPSYAEVQEPVSNIRTRRWERYREVMDPEMRSQFDALG